MRQFLSAALDVPAVNYLARPLLWRRFCRSSVGNHYFGIHSSFEEAAAKIATTTQTAGYDHEGPAQLYRNLIGKHTPCTYPIFYWTSQILARSSNHVDILDYGGHFGIKYYNFVANTPESWDFTWTVYDVPKVVDAGSDFASQRPDLNTRHLDFTKTVHGRHDDVFFSSGALQYVDSSLAAELQKMSKLPTHVIIGSLPVADRSFYTIQNIGVTMSPYQIFSRQEVLTSMSQLGYELVDHWQEHNKSCFIASDRLKSLSYYEGFYFRLKSGIVP
jgi:putative methyltransferase (TIGR04325 family)